MEPSGDPPVNSPDAIDEELRRYAETTAFRRATSRKVLALLLGPLMTVILAIAVLVGLTGAPPIFLLAGPLLILCARATVTEIRRVLESDSALEVGPDGIWLQAVGPIRWNQIGSIRLEVHTGVGGGEADRLVPYRRLGIVPSDPALVPRRSGAWAPVWAAFRPLFDPRGYAPLGVWDYDLTDPIDRVVERIRLYHEVDGPPRPDGRQAAEVTSPRR